MRGRTQILVIGYSEDHCPQDAYNLAHAIGREIVKHGAVLLSGGLGGVMEASCKGAREDGGLTVCIIPQEEMRYANPYCDIVVSTGMGWARDFITAYSADAVIVVGGGVGSLIEAAAAYHEGKAIIALKGSGGVADKIADTYFDDRKLVKVLGARSVEEAVSLAVKAGTELRKKNNNNRMKVPT